MEHRHKIEIEKDGKKIEEYEEKVELPIEKENVYSSDFDISMLFSASREIFHILQKIPNTFFKIKHISILNGKVYEFHLENMVCKFCWIIDRLIKEKNFDEDLLDIFFFLFKKGYKIETVEESAGIRVLYGFPIILFGVEIELKENKWIGKKGTAITFSSEKDRAYLFYRKKERKI